jgi:GcrA cell cycle regulator
MSWTDERVESLKKLWSEGLSASQIASRLGEVTRNAVIGKVHRLGLAGRATTSRVKTMRPRKSVARVKTRRIVRYAGGGSFGGGGAVQQGAPGMPQMEVMPPSFLRHADELVIPMEERKSVVTLTESSCRWPIGDPQHDDFHFCGKGKLAGTPYCEFHARRAFQPAQRRQDRSADKDVALMAEVRKMVRTG